VDLDRAVEGLEIDFGNARDLESLRLARDAALGVQVDLAPGEGAHGKQDDWAAHTVI
jgi:hypothetical protein